MGRSVTRQGVVLRSERVTEQGGAFTTYVVVDFGGDDIVTAQYFGAPGDDGLPEPGDYAVIADAPGGPVAIGFHDPGNAGDVLPGERRLYVRDEDGALVGELRLAQGKLSIEVLNGESIPIELKTPGAVILDSPDVRLTDEAGAAIARVGDLVAIQIPQLLAAGVPVVPATLPWVTPGAPGIGTPNPALVSPTNGGISAAGQIISGQSKATA